jgi:hypothetical protein
MSTVPCTVFTSSLPSTTHEVRAELRSRKDWMYLESTVVERVNAYHVITKL